MLTLPFAGMILLVAAAAAFVAYVLWPTWPRQPIALDAPAIPVTIAGVLFDIPPAAIRKSVQRHPGQHERIDLYFEWPALTPPQPDSKSADKEPIDVDNAAAAASASEAKRLFVTIAGLGAVLPRSSGCARSIRAISKRRRRPDPMDWRFWRSAPPRLMRAKTWSISAARPSNFLPVAPGPAARCPAPASTNGWWTRPRSRCVFRARGCRIGAM